MQPIYAYIQKSIHIYKTIYTYVLQPAAQQCPLRAGATRHLHTHKMNKINK